MADEKEAVKDSSTGESASTGTTDSSVKTPVGEQPTTKTTESAVPYDRFQEVIKAKNAEKQLRESYEAKIRELESRQPSGAAGQDKLVQRLVAGGMKEDAAKLIADSNREAMKEALAPLQAKENARAVDSWVSDIERSDPDYKKLKPQLEKAFDELSYDEKRYAVSSRKGLEWFYKSVKADALTEQVSKARAEGVKEGYESKGQKEGMAGSPKSGTSHETPLTFESIREGAIKKLSDAEYTKRLPEINAILAKGPTRK